MLPNLTCGCALKDGGVPRKQVGKADFKVGTNRESDHSLVSWRENAEFQQDSKGVFGALEVVIRKRRDRK